VVHAILYEGIGVPQGLSALMARPVGREFVEVSLSLGQG
jgi:hypothetical protein